MKDKETSINTENDCFQTPHIAIYILMISNKIYNGVQNYETVWIFIFEIKFRITFMVSSLVLINLSSN